MKHLRRYIRQLMLESSGFDVVKAIRSYVSIDSDPSSLRRLLGTPSLKSFMMKMQDQMPHNKYRLTRKLGRDMWIANKDMIGQTVTLEGPVSFYHGEVPTEWSEVPYTLHVTIPKEKIIFHSKYNDFGYSTEREVLTDTLKIKITNVFIDEAFDGSEPSSVQVFAKVE